MLLSDDMEKSIPLKEGLFLTVPKRRGTLHTQGHEGSTRISQEADRIRGKHRPETLLGFS